MKIFGLLRTYFAYNLPTNTLYTLNPLLAINSLNTHSPLPTCPLIPFTRLPIPCLLILITRLPIPCPLILMTRLPHFLPINSYYTLTHSLPINSYYTLTHSLPINSYYTLTPFLAHQIDHSTILLYKNFIRGVLD